VPRPVKMREPRFNPSAFTVDDPRASWVERPDG
jgi:hypothetical protein